MSGTYRGMYEPFAGVRSAGNKQVSVVTGSEKDWPCMECGNPTKKNPTTVSPLAQPAGSKREIAAGPRIVPPRHDQ